VILNYKFTGGHTTVVKDCCNGDSVFENPECIKSIEPKNTRYTHFSSLSASEQQAFCDFQEKEKRRHQEDIDKINKDLAIMKSRYGLEPRLIYIHSWLEVEK
jgi:hypothetical protein